MGLVYDPLLDVETVYFQTGQVNALACRYGLEHGWLDSVIHFRQRALLFLCTIWYKHSQPPLADRIGESWSMGRTPPNLCCGLLVCRMPSEATATFEPGLKGISSSLNQMVDGIVMVLNLTIVNIFIPSTLTSPGLIYPTSYSSSSHIDQSWKRRRSVTNQETSLMRASKLLGECQYLIKVGVASHPVTDVQWCQPRTPTSWMHTWLDGWIPPSDLHG